MFKLSFSKMHGAGNDFIVCHLPLGSSLTHMQIQFLCNRYRGIGADGIIILSQLPNTLIKMDFFNADGSRASMCGNGLRCATYYAYKKMSHLKKICFQTDSGELEGCVIDDHNVEISLPLNHSPVKLEINKTCCYYVDTGVPHLVILLDSLTALQSIDIQKWGTFYRFHPQFSPNGTNVNFVARSEKSNYFYIRTFERGVENETQACGTGCGAVAITALNLWHCEHEITLKTPFNDHLFVRVKSETELYLRGPIAHIFESEIEF